MRLSNSIEEVKRLRQIGKFSEALKLLEKIQKQQSLSAHEKIAILNEQSQCLWRLGQLEKAERCARDALTLARKEPSDIGGQGDSLSNLGVIFRRQGKLDQAKNYLESSLIIREQLKNNSEIASSLINLGVINWQLGELNLAENYFQRSQKLFDQLGNLREVSSCLSNLGVICRYRGELDRAEEFYQQSLTIDKQIGNQQDIASSLSNLGVIFSQRGELDKAEHYYKMSLELDRKIGNSRDIALTLNNLGIIYWRNGDFDKAERYVKDSLLLSEQIGNPRDIAESYYQLIRISLGKKAIFDAQAGIQKLTKLSQTSELPEVILFEKLAICQIKMEKLDLSSALEYGLKAINLAEGLPNFELQVDATQLLVQIHLQLYLTTQKSEHKDQVDKLLINLEQLCKQNHLHGAYVETILVQGFLKRTIFDLPGAIQRFELAELLANERNLQPIALKAKEEITQLREQLTTFQNLIEQTPDMFEQLQLKELISYLKESQAYLRQAQ